MARLFTTINGKKYQTVRDYYSDGSLLSDMKSCTEIEFEEIPKPQPPYDRQKMLREEWKPKIRDKVFIMMQDKNGEWKAIYTDKDGYLKIKP